MGREIERKFLVVGDRWRTGGEAAHCRQGYLNRAVERTVRVRTVGGRGYLTVKGITAGATRAEYDYEIPEADADAMLEELCEKPLIEKNRHRIEVGPHLWEVDEFLGENRGLVVAEIELGDEDEPFTRPDWLGCEVTGDPRYFNSNLTLHPFGRW